jgi:hypothetical protein
LIYVIQSEAGPVKVGTSRKPHTRLFVLTRQQPYDAHIAWLARHPAELIVEEITHRKLARYRLRGEWFNVPVETAIAALNETLGEF